MSDDEAEDEALRPPKAPLRHIARDPLPWRAPDDNTTECGRDVTDVASYFTRGEALELVKKHGQQRAAFLLCMTCVDRTNTYHWRGTDNGAYHGQTTWADEPMERLNHEHGRRRLQLETELRAMAELVAAHPEEFAALLAGTIVPIGELQRQSRIAKAAERSRRRGPQGGNL